MQQACNMHAILFRVEQTRLRYTTGKSKADIFLVLNPNKILSTRTVKYHMHLSSDGVGLAPLKVVQEVDSGPLDGL